MSARTPWQTGEQSIATIAGDTSGLWPAVFDAEGNLVALVNFTDKTRLIAAAPELLEALKNLTGLFRVLHGVPGQWGDYKAALAVIAKAEGKS